MIDNFLDRLIDLCLDEDLGAAGDITSNALVPADLKGHAELWAKEEMVLSGLDAFARVFQRVDPSITVKLSAQDGDRTSEKQNVCDVDGPLRSLLVAERTALNIVQRTCGMATMAAKAAEAVKGTKLKVIDTRKTSPGMRALSKKAMRDGGLQNLRFGLFDGILIKDNHIAAVGGSIKDALERAKANATRLVKIEIEITELDQLEAAIEHGAHVVMLDNMDDARIAEAVKRTKGRVELEISGKVTIERLPKLAKLGADYVSMGALTHSARSMDLSLEVQTTRGGRYNRKR
ncbi:MAG: carboxylating nicotinate-nucleotide diphosphorylase [Myxococcaceae bacterium]